MSLREQVWLPVTLVMPGGNPEVSMSPLRGHKRMILEDAGTARFEMKRPYRLNWQGPGTPAVGTNTACQETRGRGHLADTSQE